MTREELAANIRRLRQTAGISQARAAKLAGVSAWTWVQWEHAHRAPHIWRIPAIANALDCPLAAIYDPAVIAEVRLADETRERIRQQGEPELERTLNALATNLRSAVLRAALTSTPPPLRKAWQRPSRNDVALRLVERRRAAVRLAEVKLAAAEREAQAQREQDAVR